MKLADGYEEIVRHKAQMLQNVERCRRLVGFQEDENWVCPYWRNAEGFLEDFDTRPAEWGPDGKSTDAIYEHAKRCMVCHELNARAAMEKRTGGTEALAKMNDAVEPEYGTTIFAPACDEKEGKTSDKDGVLDCLATLDESLLQVQNTGVGNKSCEGCSQCMLMEHPEYGIELATLCAQWAVNSFAGVEHQRLRPLSVSGHRLQYLRKRVHELHLEYLNTVKQYYDAKDEYLEEYEAVKDMLAEDTAAFGDPACDFTETQWEAHKWECRAAEHATLSVKTGIEVYRKVHCAFDNTNELPVLRHADSAKEEAEIEK